MCLYAKSQDALWTAGTGYPEAEWFALFVLGGACPPVICWERLCKKVFWDLECLNMFLWSLRRPLVPSLRVEVYIKDLFSLTFEIIGSFSSPQCCSEKSEAVLIFFSLCCRIVLLFLSVRSKISVRCLDLGLFLSITLGSWPFQFGEWDSAELLEFLISDFFPSISSVPSFWNPYYSDVGSLGLDFHLLFFFSYFQLLCLFVIFKMFPQLDLPTFWPIIFISTIISLISKSLNVFFSYAVFGSV